MGGSAVASAVERVERGVRRFGIAASLARVASLAWTAACRACYLRERHLWYTLDLRIARPAAVMPGGFELRRAGPADIALLQDLPTIGLHEAQARHRAGADLWLVLDDGAPAFACWIFRERTPVLAARGGWLPLPPATACLEDSVAAPAYRGRGLAAAAWSAIAGDLARGGMTSIVTKVREDNAASRRAVEKAGFEPTALMSLTRLAMRAHVDVSPYRDNALFAFLEEVLSR